MHKSVNVKKISIKVGIIDVNLQDKEHLDFLLSKCNLLRHKLYEILLSNTLR